MNPKLIRIEIERIVNLVIGFGWKKTAEETAPDHVTITFRKEIPVTVEPPK